NRERAVRQRAIRRSLEDDGEPAVVALCQSAMDRELFSPGVEALADVGISWLLGEQVLVGGDRVIQVANAVLDVAEQFLRVRQLRIQLQRFFERSLRFLIAPEKVVGN